MLKSMTGFGVGRAAEGDEEIAVEIRSLNHKYCEIKARLPRELSTLEPSLVKLVRDQVARGSVEISVRRHGPQGPSSLPQVDASLAREYYRAFHEVADAMGVPPIFSVSDIAQQPGVIQMQERTLDAERAQRTAVRALQQALEGLAKMRATEGHALQIDLNARLETLSRWAQELERLVPQAVDEHRQRLADRVAELARGISVDPARLAQEVAFFAERTDVSEELTRLRSHLEQFRALVASPEPSGRRMDFLVQEMNREVNTTGSKSQHPGISVRVVSMKAEIERIREQVQNVE